MSYSLSIFLLDEVNISLKELFNSWGAIWSKKKCKMPKNSKSNIHGCIQRILHSIKNQPKFALSILIAFNTSDTHVITLILYKIKW